MKDLTVIMSSYNSQDTISRAIYSLISDESEKRLEIIVVDDCSKDNTVKIVENISKKFDIVKLIKLDKNNGGPSIPRNVGIENATGKYITFLDDDDFVIIKKLLGFLDYAIENQLDLLTGNGLITIDNGRNYSLIEHLKKYLRPYCKTEKELYFHSFRSVRLIFKKDVIINNNIRFDPQFKYGEDAVFTATVILLDRCKMDYIDDGWHIYDRSFKNQSENGSITQRIDNTVLLSMINTSDKLNLMAKEKEIDYYKLRFSGLLRYILIEIQRFKFQNISNDAFNEFHNYIKRNIKFLDKNITKMWFERDIEFLITILDKNYNKFIELCKKKILLVEDTNLNLLSTIKNDLEKEYVVLLNDSNDETKMIENMLWSDVILCNGKNPTIDWYINNYGKYRKASYNRKGLIIFISDNDDVNYNFDEVDFIIGSTKKISEMKKDFEFKNKLYSINEIKDDISKLIEFSFNK